MFYSKISNKFSSRYDDDRDLFFSVKLRKMISEKGDEWFGLDLDRPGGCGAGRDLAVGRSYPSPAGKEGMTHFGSGRRPVPTTPGPALASRMLCPLRSDLSDRWNTWRSCREVALPPPRRIFQLHVTDLESDEQRGPSPSRWCHHLEGPATYRFPASIKINRQPFLNQSTPNYPKKCSEKSSNFARPSRILIHKIPKLRSSFQQAALKLRQNTLKLRHLSL